jgi:hypothetical protein
VILRTLESAHRKTKVGKLQNISFDLELAGSFSQVHRLIAWLETDRYFTRITKLRIKGERGKVQARLAVSLLVAPGDARDKSAAAKAGGTSESKKPAAQAAVPAPGSAPGQAPVQAPAEAPGQAPAQAPGQGHGA